VALAEEIYMSQVGNEQEAYFRFFTRDVRPRLDA